MTVRSYLFVPGNNPAMLAKAPTRGADALVVDLEDAVPPVHKTTAREAVSEWLGSRAPDNTQIWVRVNNDPELFDDDLAAVALPPVAGIIVPKIADARQARRHATAVRDAAMGEPPGFIPMIETAVAMVDVEAIAQVKSVSTMMLGEYDFAAELGIELSDAGTEMLHFRSRLVLACAAAAIDPPVAPVHVNFRDLETYRSATLAFKRMGYVGRATIHPAQALVANEVFSPTPEELARAERVIELFQAAMAAGVGVVTDDAGHMIDEAVVRSARRLVAGGGSLSK